MVIVLGVELSVKCYAGMSMWRGLVLRMMNGILGF